MKKFKGMDAQKLAEYLVKLPLVANMAGHKEVQYTVNDYILPSEDNLEGQFIVDLFKMTTPEIIEKWV